MAYETLSRNTRKTRVRLINTSTAFFLINLLDVELSDLPFGLTSASNANELVFWMLLLGICYLCLSFVIYAYDDWKNLELQPIDLALNEANEHYKEELFKTVQKHGRNWPTDTYSKLVVGLQNTYLRYLKLTEYGQAEINLLDEIKDYFSQLNIAPPAGSIQDIHGIIIRFENHLKKKPNHPVNDRIKPKKGFREFFDFILPIIIFLIALSSIYFHLTSNTCINECC